MASECLALLVRVPTDMDTFAVANAVAGALVIPSDGAEQMMLRPCCRVPVVLRSPC